jgi:hypothetical protein
MGGCGIWRLLETDRTSKQAKTLPNRLKEEKYRNLL